MLCNAASFYTDSNVSTTIFPYAVTLKCSSSFDDYFANFVINFAFTVVASFFPTF